MAISRSDRRADAGPPLGLPEVQTELHAVVTRTLEPAHVSIWIPGREP